MQPAKVDVLFAFLAYGGNGGVAMQLPEITPWFAQRYAEMKADPRIGRIAVKKYGDIPLSMERNRIVKEAKDGGFDVIVMLDSDNIPDLYLGYRPEAKPFWETSFDFLYERFVKGIPTVVCAPYCGPPPHPVKGGEENVYVFYATGNVSGEKTPGNIRFEAYSRQHAAQMRGIQPCAAGPTGCIIYTTSAFDLMPIGALSVDDVLNQYAVGKLTLDRAKQLLAMQSWFFYEYTDRFQTQKASTEDVTNTREIQMAGIAKHRQPVVFCNWDAWAGHFKPKCVGAPEFLHIEQVSEVFQEAVRNNVSVHDRYIEMSLSNDDLQGPEPGPEPSIDTDDKTEPVHPNVGEERMGRKVIKPVFTNSQLSLLNQELAKRYPEEGRSFVVIGDGTGEITLAVVKSNPQARVFSLVSPNADQEQIEYGIGQEYLPRVQILKAQADVIGRMYPRQYVDAVVISAATRNRTQVLSEFEVWANHLADTEDARLFVVGAGESVWDIHQKFDLVLDYRDTQDIAIFQEG